LYNCIVLYKGFLTWPK